MPQEADFNHQDFEPQNQQAGDETLLVKFFLKSREDRAATLKEGRPMYKDVEYIDIKIPGNRTGGACRPASFADKQRFPRHYAAFKQRTEMPSDGTPLSEWPQISRSQIEQLSFANIKTVEQLADTADVHIGNFQGGNTLKRLAKEWLDNTGETALIAEKEAMQGEIDQLKEQVAALVSALEEQKRDKADIAPNLAQGPVGGPTPDLEQTEPAKSLVETKPRTTRRRRTKT